MSSSRLQKKYMKRYRKVEKSSFFASKDIIENNAH